VPTRRRTVTTGILLMALTQPATAQRAGIQLDSARVQIRAVVRAFYFHLEHQNWGALSAYVLSPKLLERRGAPSDLQLAARDRARGRGSSHATAAPINCPSGSSPQVDEATIRLDGDWAEVSVRRCSGTTAGADELRLLYFEKQWRFIYTDLFQGSPTPDR
jgi:hypothetical protein